MKKPTAKQIDYMGTMQKKDMVKLARRLGWKGDPERNGHDKQFFADLLQSYAFKSQVEAMLAEDWPQEDIDVMTVDTFQEEATPAPEPAKPATKKAAAPKPLELPEPEPEPVPQPPKGKASQEQNLGQIAGLFAQLMEATKGNLSEDQIRQIVDEAANKVVEEATTDLAEAIMMTQNHVTGGFQEVKARLEEVAAIAATGAVKTTRLEVKSNNGTHHIDGLQHRQLPELLKAIGAPNSKGALDMNVWLTGLPGTGKTTAAEMCALASGLKFYTNGSIANKYELTGFVDAHGNLIRTPFRDAWEHGGVYLFDEVDGSVPSAVLAFNAALANGLMAFPDGMVRRNQNCVVVAAANTMGQGATAELVGRMKQDAAFLDRFVFMSWMLDEDLERACVPAEYKPWVEYVQRVRRNVATKGAKVMVTPRASTKGAQLLAAGMDMQNVINMTLKKGLTEDQWAIVK